MSLRNRLSGCCLGLVSIGMVAAIGASQPARAQPRFPPGDIVVIRVPQFVATAVRFKAIDETGPDWAGSDETYAVFSDLNPAINDHTTAIFGNVDSGDTLNFGPADRCIAPRPNCDRGVSEILHFRFSFWESDGGFLYGDLPGAHYVLDHGRQSFDDLIGRGEVLMSREELLAALPTVGSSVDVKLRLRESGDYEFTYRISRLPDVERPLVIGTGDDGDPDSGDPDMIRQQQEQRR